MPLNVEVEQEEDGRWLAEVVAVPGALAYGTTLAEAVARAEAVALRAMADHQAPGPGRDR
jgi:predicted RNase H-like HicB family nuclease